MTHRLLTILVCGAGIAAADVPLGMPHLDVIPRTAEEAARIERVTALPEDFSAPQPFEAMPGGAATSRAAADGNAFSHPSANLDFEARGDFFVGNGLFKRLWVTAPASTIASDGLGPLYNARSCQRCHLKDGRGHPPEGAEDLTTSFLVKVGVPGLSEEMVAAIEGYVGMAPHPVYGVQMQDRSIPGVPAEYRLSITYETFEVELAGEDPATLRRPIYTAEDLAYGPLSPEHVLSPRVAPQMIGLGLLEAVPVEDILAWADPEDADGDGISGRAQVVWSREFDRPMLGRFGPKGSNPTIRQQSAGAFLNDMGLSSPIFTAGHGECTEAQPACLAAPDGNDAEQGGTEVSVEALDLVTFYSRNLAVPVRRDVDDPEVLHGKALFHDAGCVACHRPSFVTARLEDRPEQSFQLIWPYTDMLLHDMGPDLADGLAEGRASGAEWRTAPLWGVGLTETVNGHTYFLHDGRARSLLEAILWHGGEAEAARTAVQDMTPEERAALIRFVESL
ncbi:di-heme oxidoredictase family protein [Pontivivens ytuae]|uniref:C-type cytochrome n=1 Tax=Pontivivens ytuae TaxID=2789856 RepID=A0A7S9LRY8_9RHOB|nr:di-heme oxidoredictase family protein [Pontivivens ytuae]QPH54163.1 c-type cytochrome [Pontivivens ytuae]